MKTKQVTPPVDGVVVIGLNGIGRHVALQLASLDVPLVLIDAGRVNVRHAVQHGYFADDVGRLKTHAAAELCHRLHPGLAIETARRFSYRRLDSGNAVFICRPITSNMSAILQRAAFLGCTHVMGTSVTILTASNPQALAALTRRLARLDSPSSSVPLHIAALAASLLVGEFDRFRRGLSPRPVVRVQFNPLRLVTR